MGLFEFNDVGIDLGTASILVYVRGKGIVLREPSVVAVEKITGRILAIGEEARRMLGRTPGNITAIRPLRDGVISNYDITERLLHHFLKKVVGTHVFFKPRVVVCVPSGVTEVEKRSVIDATEEAGARHTYLIEEPIARNRRGHRHCGAARQHGAGHRRRHERHCPNILRRRGAVHLNKDSGR